MATTRDYLGYLTDKIDIAPANSQEELQAAEIIQGLMEEHGLETTLQEFDAPAAPSLAYYVLMIVLTLAVFLAGLQLGLPSVVGIIIAVLCAAVLIFRLLGSNLLGNIGSRARSQNVIGVHRAEGPLVTKGNRPIVIVAHYDTPRESFLMSGPLSRIVPTVRRLIPVFLGIVCFATIFQALAFVPSAARRVIWVIGLVAALPLLSLGIEAVYKRFSPCTDGANDNKSGVAAMLGVMAKVRPGEDSAKGYGDMLVMAPRADEGAYDEYGAEYADEDGYGYEDEYWEGDEDELGSTASHKPLVVDEGGAETAAAVPSFMKAPEKKPEPVPQVVTEVYEEIEGVRHGADVLAALRILPTSCEVVYDEPQMVSRTVRPQAVSEVRDARFGVLNENTVEPADDPRRVNRRRVRTSADEMGAEGAYDEAASGRRGGFFATLKERFSQIREKLSARDDETEGSADFEAYDENFEEFEEEAFDLDGEATSYERFDGAYAPVGEPSLIANAVPEVEPTMSAVPAVDELSGAEQLAYADEARDAYELGESVAPAELSAVDDVYVPAVDEVVVEEREVLAPAVDEVAVEQQVFAADAAEEAPVVDDVPETIPVEDTFVGKSFFGDTDDVFDDFDEAETSLFEDLDDLDVFAEYEVLDDEEYVEDQFENDLVEEEPNEPEAVVADAAPQDEEHSFSIRAGESIEEFVAEAEGAEAALGVIETDETFAVEALDDQAADALGDTADVFAAEADVVAESVEWREPEVAVAPEEVYEAAEPLEETYEAAAEDELDTPYEPLDVAAYEKANEPQDESEPEAANELLDEGESEAPYAALDETEPEVPYETVEEGEFEAVYEPLVDSADEVDFVEPLESEESALADELADEDVPAESYDEVEEQYVYDDQVESDDEYEYVDDESEGAYEDESVVEEEYEFDDQVESDDEYEYVDEDELEDEEEYEFDDQVESDDEYDYDEQVEDEYEDEVESEDEYEDESEEYDEDEYDEYEEYEEYEEVDEEEPTAELPSIQIDRSALAPDLAFEDEPDPTEQEVSMRDISGLDAEVEFDPDATIAVRPKAAPAPEGIDDPRWGSSDFIPAHRNIGRRAALFDLPDPSEAPVDPFSIDFGSTARDFRIDDFSDEDGGSGNDRHWKGGATLRSDLRDEVVEEGEELPEEVREELTDAVLSMSDDELIAHDVWFVAVGGSTLGHAGIKEFIKEHRKDVRGAFLVNLDSVGAGDLALITSEGLTDKRRTNRRIERVLSFIADDLHIPIRKAAHDWEDTDATDAMRKSIRSITVMGVDDGDNRALSQTPDDAIGAVDPGQVTRVTELIAELIRRA